MFGVISPFDLSLLKLFHRLFRSSRTKSRSNNLGIVSKVRVSRGISWLMMEILFSNQANLRCCGLFSSRGNLNFRQYSFELSLQAAVPDLL